MATQTIELSRLDPATFEHLVNALAIKTLGGGVTGFAAGPDGGRDGYFEGSAPYPSTEERWDGVWYIQSKFRLSTTGGDAQKWLQGQIRQEIAAFNDEDSRRTIPNNWIIATNVDPSAVVPSGTFDTITSLIETELPSLKGRVHIWGGQKILSLLMINPDIARHYGGLLTTGHVIGAIVDALSDSSASIHSILSHLVGTQIREQQYTKLEQAGSSADTRPGIQSLYTDLPYQHVGRRYAGVLAELSLTLAENHRHDDATAFLSSYPEWRRKPRRSRVWFIRGGPGNGKSTITQYVCQIHRAAILASRADIVVTPQIRALVRDIEERATSSRYWPIAARVPVHVELRMYAHWIGQRLEGESTGILAYLAHRIGKHIGQPVLGGTLKRAFSQGRWLFVFDGLDEVPTDVKDEIAAELTSFTDNTLLECLSDAMVVFTSRPQGYSGQFDEMYPTTIDLVRLTPSEALLCADPVLCIDRADEEITRYRSILATAVESPSIREIMTTPLQSHIMAVVVRDGGKPPERRWQLFTNFYQVIKKREANRNLADGSLSRLLSQNDTLIKALHNRLGFELHYRAEKSSGAQTSISRAELGVITSELVNSLQDTEVDETIKLLDEATRERLVLVNTPEDGKSVRFDIRPLQEFFAAEYLYESANEEGFIDRLRSIVVDSHWREVMHFLLSALVETGRRGELAKAVDVLVESDDSPTGMGRMLARRLAVGGLLTSRILVEGVSESDKRTRNLFRQSLSPVLACTDADRFFVETPPAHTASWLMDVVVDCLQESAAAEHIGALAIAHILPEPIPSRMAVLTDTISKCSEDYLGVFADSYRSPISFDAVFRPRSWVVDGFLDRVLRPDWTALSIETVESVCEVLSAEALVLHAALRKRGMPEDACAVATQLIGQLRSVEGEAALEERNIGNTILHRILPPYQVIDQICSSEAICAALDEVGGLLAASTRLIVFCCRAEAGSAISADIGITLEEVQRLPHRLKACLIEIDDLEEALTITEVRVKHEYFGSGSEFSLHHFPKEVDWRETLASFPNLGIRYFNDPDVDPHRKGFREWLSVAENKEFYRNAVLDSDTGYVPTITDLADYIRIFPEDASALKKTVAASALRSVGMGAISRKRGVPLSLPEDAQLLPHLLAYIAPSAVTRRYARRSLYAGAEIVDIVKSFVPQVDDLRDLFEDESLNIDLRAAAGVLLLADAGIDKHGCAEFFDKLLVVLRGDIKTFAIPAALMLLTPAFRSKEQAAMRFIDALLTLSRSDLRIRQACDLVMLEWREISRSPVHDTLASGIWTS